MRKGWVCWTVRWVKLDTRKVMVITLGRKRALGSSRNKWEDNIKMHRVEIAYKDMNSLFKQLKGKTGGIL